MLGVLIDRIDKAVDKKRRCLGKANRIANDTYSVKILVEKKDTFLEMIIKKNESFVHLFRDLFNYLERNDVSKHDYEKAKIDLAQLKTKIREIKGSSFIIC